MHLREPKQSPTPKQGIRHIVLGDDSVEGWLLHNQLPVYTPTAGNPFPIVLSCSWDEEAQRYAPLKPFIDAIAKRKLGSAEKIVEALDKLTSIPSANQILEYPAKFYPVLNGDGGREGIFTKWADVFPLYKDQDDPQVLKTQPSLGKALKIMARRNGPVRNEEAEAKDLEAFEDSMNNVGNIFQQGAKPKGKARASPAPGTTLKLVRVPATPLFPPGQALPPASSSVVRVPAPSSPVPSSPAPSVSAPRVIKTKRPETPVIVSSDSDGPDTPSNASLANHRNQHMLTPRPQRSAEPASMDAMSISSDDSHMSISSLHDVRDQIADPPIYVKFRDVYGNICGHITVRPRNGTMVPSLGEEVDDFMDSWGFSSALIQIVFDKATEGRVPPSLDEFASRTAKYLSRLEAAWLFKRMKLPLRVDTRRRIHAML